MMKRIHLGTIIAAHGLRGEVKLKSFTENPARLGEYKTLYDDAGMAYVISVRSANKDILIATFKHVTDRTAAEKLAAAKTKLYVPREALGEAEEGQYFVEDLKGLKALDETGTEVATVMDIVNYGAGDIVILKGEKSEFMLPFKEPFAHQVDLNVGTLRVFIPEGWVK
jgi:16S rRNA processing protein RimM